MKGLKRKMAVFMGDYFRGREHSIEVTFENTGPDYLAP
jgi:hypothetical protein